MKNNFIPSLEKMFENPDKYGISENATINHLPNHPFYMQGVPEVYGESNKRPENRRIIIGTPKEYEFINFLRNFMPEENPMFNAIENAQYLPPSIFKGTFDQNEKEFQIHGIMNESSKIDIYNPTDPQYQKIIEKGNFLENPGLPQEYSGMALNHNGESYILLPSAKSEAKIEEFAKESKVYSMILPGNEKSN